MKFAADNAQHIGAREQQQDSFGFSDPSDKAFVRHGGFLGVVADGMGGLSNGQEASAAAIRAFLAAYQTKPANETVPQALSRSLLEANRVVRGIVESSAAGAAGTTLVAAAVLDRELYWIGAGDSRIYWLHDAELTQLTADHVYAAQLNRDVAFGKLAPGDAAAHPERASLTSYLGQPEPALMDRNLRPVLLHNQDCVLLCSDGLYRALSPEEIVEGFRTHSHHACEALVKLVLSKERKQQDNLTIIALRARGRVGGFASLSIAARALLIVSACLVVLCMVAGFWLGHRGRRHAAPQPQPAPLKASSPPVTVSQPHTLPSKPANQSPSAGPQTASPVAPIAPDRHNGHAAQATPGRPKANRAQSNGARPSHSASQSAEPQSSVPAGGDAGQPPSPPAPEQSRQPPEAGNPTVDNSSPPAENDSPQNPPVAYFAVRAFSQPGPSAADRELHPGGGSPS